RRQQLVVVEQLHGVGQDRSRFAQQRVRRVLGRLLARGVLDHVALVGLQAVVGGIGGQRVERQAERLALLLARLALGFLAVALGAALGLVERDVLLRAFGAEFPDVLLEPLEFLVLRDARFVPCL